VCTPEIVPAYHLPVPMVWGPCHELNSKNLGSMKRRTDKSNKLSKNNCRRFSKTSEFNSRMNTISDASKHDFLLLLPVFWIRNAIENLGEQNYRHLKRFRVSRFSHKLGRWFNSGEKQRDVRSVAYPEWKKYRSGSGMSILDHTSVSLETILLG
jgi:hypothetical protein